jgi:hypothetical protein
MIWTAKGLLVLGKVQSLAQYFMDRPAGSASTEITFVIGDAGEYQERKELIFLPGDTDIGDHSLDLEDLIKSWNIHKKRVAWLINADPETDEEAVDC